MTELSWFALRTLPQREDMVMKILRHDGLRAHVKTEKRLRRKTKRDKVRREQVFCAAPSYCFVGLPANDAHPWRLVRRLHMIRSVVSLNGQPAPLNPLALADFLGYDDFDAPEYFKHFRTGEQEFGPGDLVRIADPAFEELTLPVKDVENGEAVFFLVLLGQTTQLRVPVEKCYKAA